MEVYEELKKEYDTSVIIIKNGIFYNCYKEDSIIINYLFGYTLLNKNFCDYTAFTDIKKVTNKLKKNDIGYVIYDKKIIDINYGDSEVYRNYLITSYKHIDKQQIINDIICKLNKMSIQELEQLVLTINS